MECNKEEAIRAKGMAEGKMNSKDFAGARKFVLKAQSLYPDLENVSQMLTVCEVHCSAEQKLFANEMNWYGILQVEQSADESTIKKQYRKLALQLHPDKNKFPGAEAAFKLIGDAQRVLLDKGLRSLHDVKIRASIRKPAPTFMASVQKFKANFPPTQPHQQQAAQQGSTNGRPTFWTACPFCAVKYQYYIEVVNKNVKCQTCSKLFLASERSMHDTSKAANLKPPAFSKRNNLPNEGVTRVKVESQVKASANNSKQEQFARKGTSSEFASKVNGKRKKKEEEESIESSVSGSSVKSEEEAEFDDNASEEEADFDDDGDFKADVALESRGEHPRRSDRQRKHVSYNENGSDDEDFENIASKKTKLSGSSNAVQEESENGSNKNTPQAKKQPGSAAKVKPESSSKTLRNENVKEKVEECIDEQKFDSDVDSKSDCELYACPDSEFHDFEKERNEEHFSVGQVWAVYDPLDAMPRFYVHISTVFLSKFKVRITWLEPDPDAEGEIEWVSKNLPASCGKFKLGKSENFEDRDTFSHIIRVEEGSRKNTYKIFPRRGEIWAVFKNWDINWKLDAKTKRNFEYEFVEILSDYVEGNGTVIAYLGKVKGFVSLFCRIKKQGRTVVLIPSNELFRFSHQVPSFKLTGNERGGLPKGSFELDPACLPKYVEEIDSPEDLVVEDNDVAGLNGSSFRSSVDEVKLNQAKVKEAEMKLNQAKVKEANPVHIDDSGDDPIDISDDSTASDSEPIEIPDPEFFDFDGEKSFEKFQIGQVWSLYSDEDGLPKYYGLITEIDTDESTVELSLKWLTSCSLPNNTIRWSDKEMPICCGRFKLKRGDVQYYTSTGPFSHLVNAEPAGKNNEWHILPRKGEVWALYRDWSPHIKCSDIDKCDYDFIEVLEELDTHVTVLPLERVPGLNSVFKAQGKGSGLDVRTNVPRSDLLRFSHQVPSFRLTNEKGGSLRGFWELDPAALPVRYFASK